MSSAFGEWGSGEVAVMIPKPWLTGHLADALADTSRDDSSLFRFVCALACRRRCG